MKAKHIVIIVSLLVVLAAGVYACIYAHSNEYLSYDGSNVNVVELYENPSDYEALLEDVDGVADVIVAENLDKTMAANDVASVVFDFRGFDTLGESFILLTAIAGSFVILSVHKKKKKEKEGADNEI